MKQAQERTSSVVVPSPSTSSAFVGVVGRARARHADIQERVINHFVQTL